jgi:hypothetical protein
LIQKKKKLNNTARIDIDNSVNLDTVGIDIPDLSAWFCDWVGHVTSMFGAGDRPAHVLYSDRIYTLLHHVEPLCPMPFQ